MVNRTKYRQVILKLNGETHFIGRQNVWHTRQKRREEREREREKERKRGFSLREHERDRAKRPLPDTLCSCTYISVRLNSRHVQVGASVRYTL